MSENSKPAGLPVLIIGAGCGGLALAHGLLLKGIPFKVFERDPTLSPRNKRDWGIACHWASPMLASLLGEEKWSRINEALVDPHLPIKEVEKCPLYNGKTGELLNEMVLPNLHRILRGRLRSFIAEDAVDVQLGKTLERISYAEDGQSVTAHFADGTSETGRLLVGADGSQSRVRTLLVGPEHTKLKKLPLAATFITASFPRERALQLRGSVHPIISAIIHPDNMMGMFAILDAADKEHPENWRFSFYISWPCSLEEQAAEAAAGMGVSERLQQGKEKSRAFADPLRTCYELVPDDSEAVYYGANGNWDPSLPEHAWDNRGGLVTLVGDAAHPMTYHRGQGLNHSIADVFKLVELLADQGSKPQAELINAYETEMRARGGEEVRLSEMNSLMLHNWAKVEQSPLIKRGVAFGSGNSKKA
ncbi:FAD/NAD(P)-binding domain-containing protein [Hypoxylon rubiginosum]|uniref:FAD/NAD(P)-binding domain-containing protein n=1 Tax=Hypoxylon rubiginosum TaxID=110542 RepID=A0ACC0DA65_9PEZI|nr:FAD/NAD(P)-binding domain-containing protein [Hypoxylon rubiginosum]